jgi:hypothetical protein
LAQAGAVEVLTGGWRKPEPWKAPICGCSHGYPLSMTGKQVNNFRMYLREFWGVTVEKAWNLDRRPPFEFRIFEPIEVRLDLVQGNPVAKSLTNEANTAVV